MAPAAIETRNGTAVNVVRNGSLDPHERFNKLWGQRRAKSKHGHGDNLMSNFAILRGNLRSCQDILAFDTPTLLQPFLQVIRSSSTSATITSLAIAAITKFFDYSIIRKSSIRLPQAMQLLSAAITHCRFEASDSAADEVVLLQILRLMELMISGAGGHFLGDESVCEMMETGLSMCCQKRLSEFVRKSAEMSMIKMCQVIFARLNDFESLNEEGTRRGSESGAEFTQRSSEVLVNTGEARLGSPITPLPLATQAIDVSESNPLPIKSEFAGGDLDSTADKKTLAKGQMLTELLASEEDAKSLLKDTFSPLREQTDDSEIVHGYSLPSIRELFRVLVELLRPQNKEHNDALRVMALRIIDVALEVAGSSIARHPSLAVLANDELCKYLFQLIRTDHTPLLNESLRVAGTLLTTCRAVLKLQQELFLSYLVECLHPQMEIPFENGIKSELYEGIPPMPKLAHGTSSQPSNGRSTPVPIKERHQLGMDGTHRKPDAREAMLESLGALTRIPSYLVELFVNYDCEVDRNDLCEDLIGLLSRNAFPDSAAWSTTSVPPLSLDALLGYIQHIFERLENEPITLGYPDISQLRQQRARKRLIIQGAMRFNASPRDGISYLAANAIIDDPSDPYSVAAFLKSTTRIAKKTLGEYISRRGNELLLKAFLETFDFTDQRVDEALRDLLYSFRLPGESQLIERIVTAFSQRYCANVTTDGIAGEDAVFTLTYSVIMLNTDQHNPNLKDDKRMTAADFARNLRGVNGGSDFASEYLSEIYVNIKTNEIILPDEHNNDKAFTYTWEGLLAKARGDGVVKACNTNVYDADMFRATWRPIVASLSYVFMSASDEAVFSRIVQGFDQISTISAKYGIVEALDRCIFCLTTMSSLTSRSAANTALNTEVQVGANSTTVSEMAVKFGRDYKSQLACIMLFRAILGRESSIDIGWDQIFCVLSNLLVNRLVPPTMSKSQKYLGIDPIYLPSSQSVQRDRKAQEIGLLSSFTSYISSYTADDPPEPSEEEIESTLCAVECIAACPISIVCENIICASPKLRENCIQVLLDRLPEPSSSAALILGPDQIREQTPFVHNSSDDRKSHAYDPFIPFVLEFCTILATRDVLSVRSMSAMVAGALHDIVRDPLNIHLAVTARAIYCLMYLLNASQSAEDPPIVKVPIILHSISRYEDCILSDCSDMILTGISLCLNGSSSLRREIVSTPDLWVILNQLQKGSTAAPGVFRVVEQILNLEQKLITADNYGAFVDVLNSFASGDGRFKGQDQANLAQNRQGRRPDLLPSKSEKLSTPDLTDRGCKAVLLLTKIAIRVPTLIEQSKLKDEEAWFAYWSPLLHSLRTQCSNPNRKVRQQACASIQHVLLSPKLDPTKALEWNFLFNDVLFVLIDRLLRPEIYQTDPAGMTETRLQVMNILCKTYLQYLPTLAQSGDLSELWCRILSILQRLMSTGCGDNLDEAVPESLKNILLVMASTGILRPPDGKGNTERLWLETQGSVERFVPGLMMEVFPDVEDTIKT